MGYYDLNSTPLACAVLGPMLPVGVVMYCLLFGSKICGVIVPYLVPKYGYTV